jgi:hypothetical protein
VSADVEAVLGNAAFLRSAKDDAGVEKKSPLACNGSAGTTSHGGNSLHLVIVAGFPDTQPSRDRFIEVAIDDIVTYPIRHCGYRVCLVEALEKKRGVFCPHAENPGEPRSPDKVQALLEQSQLPRHALFPIPRQIGERSDLDAHRATIGHEGLERPLLLNF